MLPTAVFAAEGRSLRLLRSPAWAAVSRSPHTEERSLPVEQLRQPNRPAPLARWRQPRFPSLSGGPTGCAEPQHRLLPARSPEPAISCPVHFNVLRRIGGKNYGFFVCFVFVDESSHTPKAPRPVSPREPVAIARAACWQEPAQASNSGLPAPAML